MTGPLQPFGSLPHASPPFAFLVSSSSGFDGALVVAGVANFALVARSWLSNWNCLENSEYFIQYL